MTTSPKSGIMGWPVAQSLSPRLHRYWLKHYKIAGSYEAFAVKDKDLPAALRRLGKDGLVGVNLTIPHKVAACGLVDILDPLAAQVGAVNLVVVDADGKRVGFNTDAFGFEENMRAHGFAPKRGPAFVLGAGGASRAVVLALENMGFTEIRIANRTSEKAVRVAADLGTPSCVLRPVAWDDAGGALKDVDLVVNTTSLGMKGEPKLEFSLNGLPQDACVADIVYAPLDTALLQRARRRGHRTIDGLGMLFHQARPAFRAFFGRDPEVTDDLRKTILAGEKKAC